MSDFLPHSRAASSRPPWSDPAGGSFPPRACPPRGAAGAAGAPDPRTPPGRPKDQLAPYPPLFASRLFDSDFFDEFMALTYLHRPAKPGVHEYLCRKLLEFPEDAIDRYLNQLCYLAVDSVPALSDTVVEFCRRSLRVAVKVYWLLSALELDRPDDEPLRALKRRAEAAALSGEWEPPFPEAKAAAPPPRAPRLGLPPLPGRAAPQGPSRGVSDDADRSSQNPSEELSDLVDMSGGSPDTGSVLEHPQGSPGADGASGSGNEQWGHQGGAGAGAGGRMTELVGPDGPGPGPRVPPQSPLTQDFRRKMLGSTLDLVDALGEASVMLQDVAPAKREAALLAALRAIDQEIQQAHECGIGVIFPMFCADERVLRVPALESTLLGSREKAPYLLTVEVATREPEEFLPTTLTLPASRRLSSASVASAGDVSLASGTSMAQMGVSWAELPAAPASSSSSGAALGSPGALANLPGHGMFVKLQQEHSLALPAPLRGPAGQQPRVGTAEQANHLRLARASVKSQMDLAMASLRGEQASICVEMEVVQEVPEERPGPGREAAAEAPCTSGRDGRERESFSFFGLKRAMGLCAAPAAGERRDVVERVVVSFKMHAGLDLNVPVRSPKRGSHARVPSMEALEMMRRDMRRRPGLPKPSKRLAAPLTGLVKRGTGPKGAGGVEGASAKGGGAHQRMQDMALSHRSPSQLAVSAKTETNRCAFRELWPHKFTRLKDASPFGHLPNWSVRQVIVKAGDDCRQELMAAQLLCECHDIWKEAGLPLYVRPYQVLVTSSHSALIEVVPDAMSIHSVKATMPPGASLADWFFQRWHKGTPECQRAQRNFCESMAAYSVIMYILQAKDRHNGNVLIDSEGHVVHIDFGFLISNSPGNVSFETAPFKLTREYLEVMGSSADGKPSELFDYFKVLCIQGFLALRKHKDRLMVLVEVMKNAGLPCFKGGQKAVDAMHRRFHQSLTEEQCVQLVLQMISDSMDAWRTRQYDYYQRVLNGIL